MFRTRSSWRTLAATGMLLACGLLTSVRGFEAPDRPQISLVEKSEQHPFAFEAVGLAPALLQKLAKLEPTDPKFSKLFSITVAADRVDPNVPPVAGTYHVDGARLVFVPRFPPPAGVTYRAVLHGAAAGDKSEAKIERDITIPQPEDAVKRVPTQVRHIFPSSDVLPENHLRFYVHFTQPMSRAEAYKNLELLDEQGQVVEAAFLELGEELWDPTGQRFTLLLDPGRIKRGLVPREEDGPILVAGKKYTLVVKREWHDARGQMLKGETRKAFTAGPAQDKPLDVKEWQLEPPSPDSRGLLTVRFPRPLDYALLNRLLTVTDRDGHSVAGQHIVCNDEKRWTFYPDQKWRAGTYYLVVDTVLEDSVGNRIGRAFEVDQVEEVQRKLVPEYVKIPFEVTSKTAAVRP